MKTFRFLFYFFILVILFFGFWLKKNSQEEKVAFNLHFQNTVLDPEFLDCSQAFIVSRETEVKRGENKYQKVAESLILGPSKEEKAEGFRTLVNPETKVLEASFKEGLLIIDFSLDLEKERGGSCRALALRSQIEKTFKQFSEVKIVEIRIDGNSQDVLQP